MSSLVRTLRRRYQKAKVDWMKDMRRQAVRRAGHTAPIVSTQTGRIQTSVPNIAGMPRQRRV